MIQVVKLGLRSQGLVGSLSPHIGNLSFLKSLILQNNSFHGPIPHEIGRLFRLRNISLSNNSFHGEVPTNFSQCSNLEILNLIDNNLTGNIPAELGSLWKLTLLGLSINKISGTILPFLGNLSSLTILSLGRCALRGEIPKEIAQFQGLILFSISENNIAGEVPSSIYNISALSSFEIFYNQFRGSIPPDIGLTLPNLKLLLIITTLWGQCQEIWDDLSFISSLTNCTSLQGFSIRGNFLRGPVPDLPSSIRNLLNLGNIDMAMNRLSGPIPTTIGKLHNLHGLYLAYLRVSATVRAFSLPFQFPSTYLTMRLTGSLPLEVGSLKNLATLDVSNNRLLGSIPSSLGNCLSLEWLHLEGNSFEGKIPQSLRELRGLRELDLSRNNLSGLIPSYLSDLLTNYMGEFQWKEFFKVKVLFWWLIIDVGNYGSVYKGILDQVQTTVAIKVVNLQLRGASKSFMSECKVLRITRHRNLLKILSACSSVNFQGNEFKALVYEFMANGSLEKWLHHDGIENNGQEEESRNLKLIQRLNIAIDVPSAIEYLHYHCDSTIIHGDLKPSNVLLDDEMIAHVGDFGLAKIISTISDEVVQHQSNSTAVRGTIGYVAPEYAMGNRASTIADVYSYGILLLEMFTGKRPTDNVFKDDLTLHILVESALPDQVLEIVDPYILSEHGPRSWLKDNLVSVLRIGVACSMELPRDRMQIQDVVNALCKIKKVCENYGLRQD
ncbi:unnamed protein product [Camellia sinensis]